MYAENIIVGNQREPQSQISSRLLIKIIKKKTKFAAGML